MYSENYILKKFHIFSQENGLEEENCFQTLEGEPNQLHNPGSSNSSAQLSVELNLPQSLVCSRLYKILYSCLNYDHNVKAKKHKKSYFSKSDNNAPEGLTSYGCTQIYIYI